MEWQFDFKKNVHMYAHSLTCKSENYDFYCVAEDMAAESGIGFWIEEHQVSENHVAGFVDALGEWATNQDFQYKIFLGSQCLKAS